MIWIVWAFLFIVISSSIIIFSDIPKAVAVASSVVLSFVATGLMFVAINNLLIEYKEVKVIKEERPLVAFKDRLSRETKASGGFLLIAGFYTEESAEYNKYIFLIRTDKGITREVITQGELSFEQVYYVERENADPTYRRICTVEKPVEKLFGYKPKEGRCFNEYHKFIVPEGTITRVKEVDLK